jgi:hypothetical protein
MHPYSQEDTIISAQPRRSESDSDLSETIQGPDGKPLRSNPLTRTRELFRVMGERMSSFELSRQIYG